MRVIPAANCYFSNLQNKQLKAKVPNISAFSVSWQLGAVTALPSPAVLVLLGVSQSLYCKILRHFDLYLLDDQ